MRFRYGSLASRPDGAAQIEDVWEENILTQEKW
jgi:hypothetical protein